VGGLPRNQQTAPLLSNLGSVTVQAASADVALRRIVAWASWRFLGLVVVFLALLVAMGWMASTAVLWWDTKAIVQEQSQKDQLQTEVANLQAARETWVQAGMLDKITRCGPDNRPCVEVDESAGPFGSNGGPNDYRVLQGY
jgi:hypothetical protein